MVYKSILGAVCACLVVVSFNVNAALIKFTYTTADYYTGGFANLVLGSFTLDDVYLDGTDSQLIPNHHIVDLNFSYDIHSFDIDDINLDGSTVFDSSGVNPVVINGAGGALATNGDDILLIGPGGVHIGQYWKGSWTSSPVPVPAAVWLFGSGLIGLAGVARRIVRD